MRGKSNRSLPVANVREEAATQSTAKEEAAPTVVTPGADMAEIFEHPYVKRLERDVEREREERKREDAEHKEEIKRVHERTERLLVEARKDSEVLLVDARKDFVKLSTQCQIGSSTTLKDFFLDMFTNKRSDIVTDTMANDDIINGSQ